MPWCWHCAYREIEPHAFCQRHHMLIHHAQFAIIIITAYHVPDNPLTY